MTSKGRYVMQSLLGDNTMKKVFGCSSDQGKGVKEQHEKTLKHKWKIKALSSLANSVISQCARTLSTTPGHLQSQYENLFFETQCQDIGATDPLHYARGLLKFCCIKALSVATRNENFLNNNGFRRFTFEAMVAWEAPKPASEPDIKDEIYESASKEDEDEDASLFYSDLMPFLAEAEETVGLEAFACIAPYIPMVADIITVHEQFESLTSSTGHRLPYPLYDKYLGALDKSAKDMKNKATSLLSSNLSTLEGEQIIDVDGMSQTVIQHIGSAASSGRLTLTNNALYFEECGVVSYHKFCKYDLSADLDHDVRPDLTGPWGSRIFDKAIAYKTSFLPEAIVFEFPEITGSKRRDYWLAVIREIMYAHKFIRNFKLERLARSEALARAVLGIIRLQAIRECFQLLPPYPERLLTFSLAEEYPGGDLILDVFAQLLLSTKSDRDDMGALFVDVHDTCIAIWNSSIRVLHMVGLSKPEEDAIVKTLVLMGEVKVGELTPLEAAVQKAREQAKQVGRAKSTVEEVKVEGIGTNVAVLNELLLPVMQSIFWMRTLLSWQEPFKTTFFFILFSIIIYRDWLGYMIPVLLISACAYIIWSRVTRRAEKYREILVPTPSGGISLEQVVTVQRALSQVEGIIQIGNVVLLKIWALLLSASPQATNLIVLATIVFSLALAILPFRFLALGIHVSIFTSQLMKKTSEGKGKRRLREWWDSIPVVPVRFVESEEQKAREDSFKYG